MSWPPDECCDQGCRKDTSLSWGSTPDGYAYWVCDPCFETYADLEYRDW